MMHFKQPPKQLPWGMEALVEPYHEAHHAALHIMNLASLAQLADNSRFAFESGDGEEAQGTRPNFITCLVAPLGSCKSEMVKISSLLLKDLQQEDDLHDSELATWNRNKEMYGRDEAGPKPVFGRHLLPPDASQPIFFENLQLLRGNSTMIVAPELDSLSRSKNCWIHNPSIMRLLFDQARGGQQRKTSNGVSCYQKLYANIALSATPECLKKWFNNAEDGTISRILFATLPDDRGQKRQEEKPRSAENRQVVQQLIDRLRNEKVPDKPYQIPRIKEALENWCENKRKLYLMTGNEAVETFRRRCRVIGIRAGAIAYLLEGHEETEAAINFALWVAEVVMQTQMLLFGEEVSIAFARDTKILSGEPLNANQIIFTRLSNSFTLADIRNALEQFGLRGTGYRSNKQRWLKHGLIKPDPDNEGTFFKTEKGQSFAQEVDKMIAETLSQQEQEAA